MKRLGLILIFIVVVQIHGQCPKDEGFGRTASLHRVGNSRFYIIHGEDRMRHTFSWNNAWYECRRRGGMKLAILDKLTTFFAVANYWRTHTKAIYKDTWYWLAAKYNPRDEVYEWYDDRRGRTRFAVNYTNFFYRQPRPIGVGAHQDPRYEYLPTQQTRIEQCISFTFPWPINDSIGQYGFAPTFDERACVSRQKRHVMCEAPRVCDEPDPGPYVLAEGNEDYFDKGNFIFGDRLYVVNWGHRNFASAKKYCEDIGLEMYNPQAEDHCLIPSLKLWARNVTTSQFWVSWTYDTRKQQFLDAEGNLQGSYDSNFGNNREKQKPGYFDFEESQDIEGRSRLDDKELCVSFSHRYEFKVQLYCPNPEDLSCKWHYIYYGPSNCNMRQGVICQHKDYKKRSCTWRSRWTEKNRLYEGVKATAMAPFGFQTNKQYLRSTYKQTFGSLYCPPGYSMIRGRDKKWLKFPDQLTEDDRFKYDFEETYWVVDKEKFEKPKGVKCTISTVVNKKRVLLKVPCTEWHFYICKKRFKSPIVPKPAPPPGYKEPTWSWNNDQPTPRQYSF
ncbi:unnamed protein product [Orchesella dallaii]|uniref:C-type lectin domain-containing protein n=1 Tax=Orchesella dallaii TaxID=48710 RepID=A0ABP1R182_9HEXA